MPRAEIGSAKHQSKQLKAKGLGRLRWYCTPCEKQCRDENGFRCHVNSESHVRNMESVRENLPGVLRENSDQFVSAFVQLLRTSHQEKPVHINRFYQTYIADPHHLHLNATRWSSLTQFAQHLGREGICRVEEKDDGIYVAWTDTSLGALKRKEAVAKDQQQLSAEKREQKLLHDQITRARDQELEKAARSKSAAPDSAAREQGPSAVGPVFFKIGAAKSNAPSFPPNVQPSTNVFRAARKRSRKNDVSSGSADDDQGGLTNAEAGEDDSLLEAELLEPEQKKSRGSKHSWSLM